MSEARHLADSLERLFSNPASGVFAPFINVTDGLTAAQAAAVPAPRFNSIWAVVNHVWFWEESLLRLLRGESATPESLGATTEHGWPPAGSATDEAGWQAARTRALATNAELAQHIRSVFYGPRLNGSATNWIFCTKNGLMLFVLSFLPWVLCPSARKVSCPLAFIR